MNSTTPPTTTTIRRRRFFALFHIFLCQQLFAKVVLAQQPWDCSQAPADGQSNFFFSQLSVHQMSPIASFRSFPSNLWNAPELGPWRSAISGGRTATAGEHRDQCPRRAGTAVAVTRRATPLLAHAVWLHGFGLFVLILPGWWRWWSLNFAFSFLCWHFPL